MGLTRSSSPIRIALVEDDAQLTEELLEQLGRQPDLTVVGQAASAPDAAHLITAQPVDVVVTDIRMDDLVLYPPDPLGQTDSGCVDLA